MRIAIDIKEYRRDALVMLVISVFLTFMNPYNATGQLSFPLAFLYWFGMIFTGGFFATIAMKLYEVQLPDAPLWGRLVIASVVSALAVSIFIISLEEIFNRGVPLSYWPRVYGLVLVISIAVSLITYVTERAFTTEAPAAANDTPPEANFLQRLPVKFHTATLHAIASEDHYLRVYTSLGEELILMRLADAVRELDGAEGLRVHRSWWIAKAGITDEKKQDSRSLLILPNGTEVPISRSYRAKAKEAGLIG